GFVGEPPAHLELLQLVAAEDDELPGAIPLQDGIDESLPERTGSTGDEYDPVIEHGAILLCDRSPPDFYPSPFPSLPVPERGPGDGLTRPARTPPTRRRGGARFRSGGLPAPAAPCPCAAPGSPPVRPAARA